MTRTLAELRAGDCIHLNGFVQEVAQVCHAPMLAWEWYTAQLLPPQDRWKEAGWASHLTGPPDLAVTIVAAAQPARGQ